MLNIIKAYRPSWRSALFFLFLRLFCASKMCNKDCVANISFVWRLLCGYWWWRDNVRELKDGRESLSSNIFLEYIHCSFSWWVISCRESPQGPSTFELFMHGHVPFLSLEYHRFVPWSCLRCAFVCFLCFVIMIKDTEIHCLGWSLLIARTDYQR